MHIEKIEDNLFKLSINDKLYILNREDLEKLLHRLKGENFGIPALLEQTAEECTELAQASLKLARKMRGNNPTPKDIPELIENLEEEVADVDICIKLLADDGIIDTDNVIDVSEAKEKRWMKRLEEEYGNE